jgi:hypothetical protein
LPSKNVIQSAKVADLMFRASAYGVRMEMLGSLPYPVLRDAILTHPTMAEGLNVLLTNGFT